MDLAAKELGYSQPAISYQVKCLERVLGVRLFTRNPGGAKLTMEGEIILPSARAALMLFDSIKSMSRRSTGGNVGGNVVNVPGQQLIAAAADPLRR